MLKRYHDDEPLATAFAVLPAIDLRGGRVVRLRQGDFSQETTFSDEPVAIARQFVDAGATWLHVVDLDGARSGTPVHAPVIAAIVAAVGDRTCVEVAGGLRTEQAVAQVLAIGAARAVVGTAALRDPAFAGRLVARHGTERIAVALDVRDGLALGEAWRQGATGQPAEAILAALADRGVSTFEATSIERDGSLSGPDVDLVGRLVGLDRGSVIASGGIDSVADLRAVRAIGASGAIVGRAIYEGRLSLEDALTATR